MVAGGKINLSKAFSKAAKGFNRFAHSDLGHAVGDVATMGLDAAARGGKLNFGKVYRGVKNFARSDLGHAVGDVATLGLKAAVSGGRLRKGSPEAKAHMARLASMRGRGLGKTLRQAKAFARSDLGKAVGRVGVSALDAVAGKGFVPMGMGVRSKAGYELPRYYGNVLGDGMRGGFLTRGGAAVRIPNTDALSGDFLRRDINNTTGAIRGRGLLPLG